MLSGLNNCASSLGAMAGPPISGAITQLYGFSWSVTLHASIFAFMVRKTAEVLICHISLQCFQIQTASKMLSMSKLCSLPTDTVICCIPLSD